MKYTKFLPSPVYVNHGEIEPKTPIPIHVNKKNVNPNT